MKIQELSVSERILLAERLWDSVASENLAINIPEAQIQELDRRLAKLSEDQDIGSPWEEVKSRIIGQQ